MKVLHISTTDRNGGAGIAAYRLSEAMKGIGIDSKLLVLEKISDSGMVVAINEYKFKHYDIYSKLKKALSLHLNNALIKPYWNYSMGISHVHQIMNIPEIKEADVIYIHWVHDSFMNIRDIANIFKTGKLVFVFLHDMWHFTGGCYYSMGCDGYMHSCKQCPIIGHRLMKNMSHKILRNKIRLWSKHSFRVIGPSRWMADCARKSSVFHQQQVVCIPNTLNNHVFRVMDKRLAREVLGLPQDRRLVLYGAIWGTSNPYKGWAYADRLMQRIGKEADLVVFGGVHKSSSYKTHAIGRLYDEYSLAYIYNAVDVFISPTQAENLSQTIIEAICCGTKAVVFNVGGCSDIVKHLDNGYLATPNDVDDLERGVRWVIESNNDEEERLRLHEGICSTFSYPVVAAQHLHLIEDSLKLMEHEAI